MLTLTIKKKWFDMIKSGEKLEEYREIKPYWTRRFINSLYDLGIYTDNTIRNAQGTIIFKNGYQKDSPKIKCFIELRQDYGKTKWGAIANKKYYVLKILSIEKVK